LSGHTPSLRARQMAGKVERVVLNALAKHCDFAA
jgi:hypothetical protein